MSPTRSVPASVASRGDPAAPVRMAGVTLIELVVTLAIAGIVAGLGAPSFLRMLTRHAIEAQAQQLQDAVRLGRSEAMKRGGPVVLCRTDVPDTHHCAGSGGSWQTWLLFADVDRNGAFGAGDTLVRQQLEASNRLRVTGSAAGVRFEPTGIAHPDNGAAVEVLFAPEATSSGAAGSDGASRRRVCIERRGEATVIAGGATCP